MSIHRITALLLTTEEWSATARKVGELITTTAPGHCGHCYATYRVVWIEPVGDRYHAHCERVIIRSQAGEDGFFRTSVRRAEESDIQPGTGLLRSAA